MRCLGQSVHDHLDSIMSFLCSWQAYDKIHGYMLPLPLENLQWLKQTYWPLVLYFYLLTSQTPGHVFCNLSLHAWPPKVPLHILEHLVPA